MATPRIDTLPIDALRPAPYNPRSLDEEAQQALTDSISRFGIIKPIVVRRSDKLILAGHQRTVTARLLGMKRVPVFQVDDLSGSDEVRFNQLHNMTEISVSAVPPLLHVNLPADAKGFTVVRPQDVTITDSGEEGAKVYNLARMVNRFGQFANAVCTRSGEVIVSHIYAKTIKLMDLPLMVYVVEDSERDEVIQAFAREYGKFCYDHIERNTFIQSFAQKYRLRTKADKPDELGVGMTSILYEKVVLPKLRRDARVLDFGAGQKDYVRMLSANGIQIDGLEFYHRFDNAYVIDTGEVDSDVRTMLRHLEQYGRYDVVVCDSVLNSVDSPEAERAVLRTLSALCKPGGWIFFSGMPLRRAVMGVDQKSVSSTYSTMSFLDDDFFTANMRDGGWFFQHYHNMERLLSVTRQCIGNPSAVFSAGVQHNGLTGELHASSWQCAVQNQCAATRQELLDALRFEFTLPLPSGKRYEYDRIVLPVMEKLL